MRKENWCRVAEYQIIIPIEYAFLCLREIIEAEKAWTFIYVGAVDIGCAACYFWIVLNTDRKPFAGYMPHLDVIQIFVSSLEFMPCIFLLSQKLNT